MNDSGNNIVILPTGELKLTGFAPTVTVTPTAIIDAVKKSELSLTEQTALITIVTHITNTGILNTEKLIYASYEALRDTPELFNKLIEIIKLIYQSC